MLKLLLSTPENRLMESIIADWDKQLASQKLPKSILNSLRNYEAQLKPDKTYGVYVLCNQAEDGEYLPPYEAFVHVNHAHPKSKNPVLRLTWSRIAPCHEWSDNHKEKLAEIWAMLFFRAYEMAKGSNKSSEIKFYLLTNAERAWAREFSIALNLASRGLTSSPPDQIKASVKGSWLHIELI